MSKKNIITLIIVILIFVLGLFVFLYSKSIKSPKNSNENVISQVSENSETVTDDFHFFDIDGNSLNLENFSDKPIVILFWKSDNSTSYNIIDLLEQNYDSYKDSINFLAINVNEPNIDLEIVKHVKAANFTLPMYFDTDLTAQNKYNYKSLPYMIFINKDGEILNESNSMSITDDMLKANFDLLINNY